MDISSTVDWISCTDHDPKDSYPGMEGNPESAPGLHSYTHGAIYPDSGLWIMWSPNRPSMGLHLMYGGETLRNIAAQGTLPDALLKALVGLELKITRLDLAIDIKDLNINLERIKVAVKAHSYQGRERYYDSHESSDDGFSLYVGSPRSDRRLRVYNKGVEQKILRGQWYRSEIQLRRKVAQTISRAFSSGSMGNLHSAAWATMSAVMPRLQSADWREFGRSTEQVGVPTMPRQTNTEEWLIRSIAPTIAKFRHDHPDSKAIVALKKALGVE